MSAEFLTVAQVAELLQVHEDTVRRLVKRGELHASRVGSRVRVARGELERYLGRPLPARPEEPISDGQNRAIHAKAGVIAAHRKTIKANVVDEALAKASERFGHTIEHCNELCRIEASWVIDHLAELEPGARA